MACRLPGHVSSASEFWQLLVNGRSGQCEFPTSRLNVDGFFKAKGDAAGSINMRGGYFLQEDIRAFENDFFGINNLEATYMDPQQRKLLEVVFECFETAGATLEKLSGSNTGCYVGNFTMDHTIMQMRGVDELHRYSKAGMGPTILSNRISHVFNLNGPSLVLDTACSSSMYCLHTACVALEMGDCDAAIVAAANLIQSADEQVALTKVGVLSKTSTCHTFDATADGYARADAVGALYLKRLSDAIRDGDPIRAVIRGTAVNANGKTQGITLPSADHQEKVIRKAYERAGLEFQKTTYVECHGTGTPVGDPIEVEAISRVFKGLNARPLRIGSVKTSVGHSEAASAISSVIKVVMALENNFIPPTIGVTKVNPKINPRDADVEIVTKGQPWSTISNLVNLRAGVNSFGYGGANGHIVLENSMRHLPCNYEAAGRLIPTSRTTFILPFSASTAEALKARVKDLSTYNFQTASVQDLAYTLGCRRSHLETRGYILASSNSMPEDISLNHLRMASDPIHRTNKPYAFIFTGQGAQWPQMCMELFEEFEVFRTAIEEMDSVLQKLPYPPTWALKDTIQEPRITSKIMDPVYSQPICTAIQVGLVLLLQSWNIVPATVVGHSSGEIAAAFTAGFISLPEAITIAYYRGLVTRRTRDGAMIVTEVSKKEANTIISALSLGQNIRVACINSPENVTISGDSSAIDILLEYLKEKDIFARKLQTLGRAYHSHHMRDIGDDYEDALQALGTFDVSAKNLSGATWISSITGTIMERTYAVGPRYWRRNLESPVDFMGAITQLIKLGAHHIIEIGPHSTLELPIKQIRSKLGVTDNNLLYSASIIRYKNAALSLLALVGQLYIHGYPQAFEKINGLSVDGPGPTRPHFRVLPDLPPYRWTYADEPLWYEPRASSEFRFRKFARHELLGSQVPGGNGVEYSWKNAIKLDESPWLKDHKLDDEVVFPGAGYLAMAVEAIRQVTNSGRGSKSLIHLKNINILSALVLPQSQGTQLDLCTTLRPTPLSYASISSDWWDFSIVSNRGGVSTIHTTGTLRVVMRDVLNLGPDLGVSHDCLEPCAPRVWYERMANKGLVFGPEFQTIRKFAISRQRSLRHCQAAVPLKHEINGESYAVHPVTVDAMLQTAIVATTAGILDALDAKVPTCIGAAFISLDAVDTSGDLLVNSKATSTGFACARVDAELVRPGGEMIVKLENVRLVSYKSGRLERNTEERHPMLRVIWMPDASPGLMTDDDLTMFLETAAGETDHDEAGVGDLLACISILGHKNPYLRLLELGMGKNRPTESILDALAATSSFPELLSYTLGTINDDGQLFGSKVALKTGELGAFEIITPGPQFDLIILNEADLLSTSPGLCLKELSSLLNPWGRILTRHCPIDNLAISHAGLTSIRATSSKGDIILLHRLEDDKVDPGAQVSAIKIVERTPTALGGIIMQMLRTETDQNPERVLFDTISADTIPPSSTVISLLELTESLLAKTSEADFELVKRLINQASNLVWVTGGNLLTGQIPDYSLAFGLSRAVMMEQPSLRFFVFDVDNADANPSKTARNIIYTLMRFPPNLPDFEFVERRGMVHVSRFVPDDGLNKHFRMTQGRATAKMPIQDIPTAELSIRTPGQFDGVFFKEITLPEFKSRDVQVSVRAIGLNAKDFYALGGRVETKNATCILEFSGVVERTGSAVSGIKVGDRVCVMAPSRFRTSEIVPEWACCKLKDGEDFNLVTTIPLVFATAVYALHMRARVQRGESILIHSGTGGVGIAAIQISQLAGMDVFTTVSTEKKKKFLVEQLGVRAENIFSSRDGSFETGVMKATNGNGVDVVLNSLTGDLLRASWRCCGPFGRFVEIGRKDLVDAGLLEMDPFLRNTTYTGFDLTDLYNSPHPSHHKIWARLLVEVMNLYREKKLLDFPVEVFDIGDLPNGLRKFGSRNRIGKVVINLENPTSKVEVELPRYTTSFHSHKAYLMIGCLGGLGRSLSKWMLQRGARKFVYLSRSGLDKEAARRLVQDLASLGAQCKVIRGDVSVMSDVETMVAAVDGPIGGVVQAAMGLKHALLSAMPNCFWRAGINPKVQGTWNVHNAINGRDSELDFFLLTSSISGSIGTATESNYCSANFFLDQFARYRRTLGLPATSVGLGMISEVGYLHENPEIESLLLRKGIHQLNESDMLAIIDASLSLPMSIRKTYDNAASAHVLTGLEPFGMIAIRKSGFTGSSPLLKNSRAALLARAIYEPGGDTYSKDGDLPVEISKAKENGLSMPDAITSFIAKRFGDLVLVPADEVNVEKPLDGYGMDSMIAAEFRSWFHQVFKVDIPFLELLSKDTTVRSLGKAVVQKMASN
ncbi:hypothetical protein TWF696_000692 [Orbilia brochopaga]|uniref:Uncharacterized protein n=1 Tax=Orbilia brochopaga TaxID=3140254 RepID=A0AAV9VEP0_9PEZI